MSVCYLKMSSLSLRHVSWYIFEQSLIFIIIFAYLLSSLILTLSTISPLTLSPKQQHLGSFASLEMHIFRILNLKVRAIRASRKIGTGDERETDRHYKGKIENFTPTAVVCYATCWCCSTVLNK